MNFRIALVASAVMALAGALTVAGCGGDACTDAADHVAECVPATSGTATSTSGEAAECTGQVECAAKCTTAASCDTLLGKDPDGAKTLTDCLAKCTSS